MIMYHSAIFWFFFFVKQKTAYEMRISDWSSDVCSSDLRHAGPPATPPREPAGRGLGAVPPTPLSSSCLTRGSICAACTGPCGWRSGLPGRARHRRLWVTQCCCDLSASNLGVHLERSEQFDLRRPTGRQECRERV